MSSLLPSSFIRSKATNQKNKIVLTKRNSHEPNLSDQNETLMNQISLSGNFWATVISGTLPPDAVDAHRSQPQQSHLRPIRWSGCSHP